MKKWYLNTYGLVFILIVLSVLNISIGTVDIFEEDTESYTILFEIRVPKILSAIAAGGVLSLCGLVLQILFRNPLAGPYVLGISSAASLFTAIGIMSVGALSAGIFYSVQLSIFSVIGAILGLLVVFLLLRVTSNISVLLVAGLMLAHLYSAIQSILSYTSTANSLKIYTLWTMGSIQNTTVYQAVFLLMTGLLGLFWFLRYTKFLMVYIIGDEEVIVMGMPLHKFRKQMILLVGVLVGLVTAFCGPIALVGMSIPIVVRILSKNAHVQQWIKHSFLYGAISILLTDLMNQLFFNGAMPLNILISMWGVPLILWILIRETKWFQI